MTYKQSEILHIKIKELFNIEKGTLQSSKCIEGQYDFITASSEWKTHNEFTHDTEAIIIAVAASGSLGRAHYVNGKFISSDLCFILTPKSEKYPLDLSFYYYIFDSIRDDLVQSTATGTSKLAINKSNFGAYQIPYLDISKQKEFKNKLVNITERKGQLVTINERQTEIIQSLRQQILQDATTGKLSEEWRKENPNIESAEVLLEKIKTEKEKLVKEGKIRKQKPLPPITENEIQFALPEGWVWCRLADLLLSSDYGTSEKAFPDSTGVPVLGMGNIQDQKVILDAPKKLSHQSKDLPRLLLKYNDLLFNRTNSYELVGKSAIYKGNDDEYTFASYLIRLKFPLNLVIPDYISFVINSNWFRQYIIEPQIIQQTGQANFNGTKLSESYIPVPPTLEQEYIVQKVGTVISKMDEMKNQNSSITIDIEVLNKTILKDMFTE